MTRDGREVVGTWQPIATAPKDGRTIRVQRRDGVEEEAHWHNGAPDDYQPPVNPGWYCLCDQEFVEMVPPPVAWLEKNAALGGPDAQ